MTAKTRTLGGYKKLKVKNEFCNAAIMQNYKDEKFMLMPSDFIGAFAYYVAVQAPEGMFIVNQALNRFYYEIVNEAFENVEIPQEFTFKQLQALISDKMFEQVEGIAVLNTLEPDFIDLYALALNVRFMIMRQTIVEPL